MTTGAGTSTADATAAPTPVILGGQEFLLSPMTDADVGEMDRWIRDQFIGMVRDSIPADASVADRQAELALGYREAAGLSMLTGTGAKLANSLTGWARIIWIGLRARHPEMTPAKVFSMLLNASDLMSAQDAWEILNAGSPDEDGASGEAERGAEMAAPAPQ